MDAPIQPEVVSEIPPPVTPKPWGFWATIGLSLVVIGAFLTVQTIAVLGYFAVRYQSSISSWWDFSWAQPA
jgi:hypothetical protein